VQNTEKDVSIMCKDNGLCKEWENMHNYPCFLAVVSVYKIWRNVSFPHLHLLIITIIIYIQIHINKEREI